MKCIIIKYKIKSRAPVTHTSKLNKGQHETTKLFISFVGFTRYHAYALCFRRPYKWCTHNHASYLILKTPQLFRYFIFTTINLDLKFFLKKKIVCGQQFSMLDAQNLFIKPSHLFLGCPFVLIPSPC
jgi:hypothetical protein